MKDSKLHCFRVFRTYFQSALTHISLVSSPIRSHLIELQLPHGKNNIREAILQLHGILKEKLESHIDSNGHTINEHTHSHILGSRIRYSSLFGEKGATFYLRERFNPDHSHNWSLHNEGIMDAFYAKQSIKRRETIKATNCGNAWVHESLIKDDA